jgi:hypothetical protein
MLFLKVCPTFAAPLIKRVLDNFVLDEFCPDPIPDVVFEALDTEVSHIQNEWICFTSVLINGSTQACSWRLMMFSMNLFIRVQVVSELVLVKKYTSNLMLVGKLVIDLTGTKSLLVITKMLHKRIAQKDLKTRTEKFGPPEFCISCYPLFQ